jgi:hypothetical protein
LNLLERVYSVSDPALQDCAALCRITRAVSARMS